ncbi:MAG: CSLREA domain-containing protein [Isosphaeraceae bacterium]
MSTPTRRTPRGVGSASQRPNRGPRNPRRTASRPSLEALEARSLLATLLVTTVADTVDPTDDQLSLREAIQVANGQLATSSLSAVEQGLVFGTLSYPAPNGIVFGIAGSGVQTINVDSPLPTITAPLFIDGYSQSGSRYNPTEEPDVDRADLMIRIDGHALAVASPSTIAHGIDIQSPNCTISGLIITGFTGAGVSISGAASQGNWLYGNIIGVMPRPVSGRDFVPDPS